MAIPLIFEVSMLISSICGFLVAVWLLWRARKQADLQALAGFAIMMAIWCFGHVALYQGMETLGIFIVLANPLMPTFFLHFAIRFVYAGQVKSPWLKGLGQYLWLVYLTSILVVLHSWWVQGGSTVNTHDTRAFFVFTDAGIFNLAYTVLVGVLAHGVLLYGWLRHQGNKKRSILAMFGVGAWGLLLATSFVFPSFGISWFPYPMLLLPSYLLLLVYGVVRYQILSVNAFANRALLWLAMMLVMLCLIAVISVVSARLGLQALANVPSWQLWFYSLLMLVVASLIHRPLTRIISRVIYPGATLSEELLEAWSRQLKAAHDWPSLNQIGERLLSEQVLRKVTIQIHGTEAAEALAQTSWSPPTETTDTTASSPLTLEVSLTEQGWQFSLHGWEDASPGMRLTAEVFGSLFSTSCSLLERSLALAAAERKRLDEQHLVELGRLSAAMAHELRNPLNIIAMAAYDSPADTRQHIQTQLQRADRLVSDMLVYSGGLHLQVSSVPLAALVNNLLSQSDTQQVDCQVRIADDLHLVGDFQRLQQVFINLIDNALAYVRDMPDGKLLISAQQQAQQVVIQLHNNGPAIEPSMQGEAMFQPFVTKRSGGSGLGLAIVRRIVKAHGGRIRHRSDCHWPVTFELSFPQPTHLAD